MLFQGENKGDDVQRLAPRISPTQRPAPAASLSLENFFYLQGHSFQIEYRMAGKYLGKSIGQIAGQTLAGAFLKFQFELQGIAAGIMAFKDQANIVSPFFQPPVQGFKKLIRPLEGQAIAASLP